MLYMFTGKHILIILSLYVQKNFRSVVLKVGGITPSGAILRGKGLIKPKGEIDVKQHKGGKNLNH